MISESSSDVRIRRAVLEDAPSIARVHVESWKTTYAGIVPEEVIASRTHAERERRWREIFSDPEEKQFVFVAETNPDGIVGFACGGGERSGDSVYDGEVSAIYLLQSWQRLGIGRKLMAAAAEELIRRGFSRMLLWVLAANPAGGFYEALGGRKVRAGNARMGHDGASPEIGYGWDDIPSLLA